MTDTRDFSQEPPTDSTTQRPTHIDIEAQDSGPPIAHHDHVATHPPDSPQESIRQRRINRSNTAKTYRPERRGQSWQPGQEPGVDPAASSTDFASQVLKLYEKCEISVVDFSQDDMLQHHFDNSGLESFIAVPRPSWAQCRWISVNGLSWDVIKTLGTNKGLHRLAIEDLLSHNQRTKADWYSDHTYSMWLQWRELRSTQLIGR